MEFDKRMLRFVLIIWAVSILWGLFFVYREKVDKQINALQYALEKAKETEQYLNVAIENMGR